MNVWNHANPQLKDLVTYKPGKPIEELARERGMQPGDIIKMASNENPLGPSPKAVAAMTEALSQAHIYPDGFGFKLRDAIAKKFDVGIGQVVLGNGSNEIIEFIGHAFLKPGDNIVTAEHAFVVYKLMATLFGAETIEVPDPGFVHDLDAMLAAITPETKELFIANPNNPTGTMVSMEALERFMDQVPDHVVVVIDEAYYEFVPEPPDTMKFVREGRNVILLRTFSKIQGLAGLRIGYGIGPEELIGVLHKTRQPFNANSIAQAGAVAGLLDNDHQETTRRITDEGRTYFQTEFERLGLKYVPSFANFVLVHVGDGDAIFQKMLDKGVIVRAMAEYKLPEWVRISVGTMEQNRRCIATLEQVL
ncbi:histidinol-phosphate transaminase [Phragmitibacter flavus]|uniref:Histidinol-phosphate aminotransferase n=1 Tax=Phragmitibacter flavus TaxID=2576071 RepID=A0A5R8KCT0_9BACT|nr:histidinol-phosphate transaminase [Phragmitibacter flavus]TLD70093.1 histidinol-phosphate transaminase [Phragmitibacter flavus]